VSVKVLALAESHGSLFAQLSISSLGSLSADPAVVHMIVLRPLELWLLNCSAAESHLVEGGADPPGQQDAAL